MLFRSKAAFYLNFIEHMAPLLSGRSAAARGLLARCARCGAPTTIGSDSSAGAETGDADVICTFCSLVQRSSTHDPVPVEFISRPRARRGR